ncbi:MAG TPA: hypothetical protein VFA37_02510 [Gaiellaceae bacterium]|nr:hypothetical protein [Gaiellaceae bacterium]
MSSTERLLVNYWYLAPVGHALEGMRYALGYKSANPDLSVSLLLNGGTAVELARLCPFIENVYAVPYTGVAFVESSELEAVDGAAGRVRRGVTRLRNHLRWRRYVQRADPLQALAGVPREWDWLVEDGRIRDPRQNFPSFLAFYEAAHAYFEPAHPVGVAGAAPPAYEPNQQLRLELPADARAAAAATIGESRRAISVVLAGSSADRHLYPSNTSWKLILRALSDRYPDAAILLIGKTTRDGRTLSRVAHGEVEALLEAVPAAVDCFNRPLLEQVALVEGSDLLVSPHTGFSFVASTVGTPWLAISGGNWHEYFFNGEPFYSLLPDPDRYPAFAWGGPPLGDRPLEVIPADEDGEGPRTPSMSIGRIREDLPELLHASELLIERRLSYEDALAGYFPRLLATYGGDRARAFSFDNVGERYLPGPRN